MSVAGHVEDGSALYAWVKATNDGGAAMTIDTLSVHVRGRRPHEIEAVRFRSGPRLPLRLESYSSAEWTSMIKVAGRRQWMADRSVDCSAFVSAAV